MKHTVLRQYKKKTMLWSEIYVHIILKYMWRKKLGSGCVGLPCWVFFILLPSPPILAKAP